ncbi:MAG: hypothetical protein PWP62_1186 [Eubacteriaceae bacterium]|nr:hypothetical protein [Eubacteriaceae bacterium]MDK2962469.1 hypothetical protein [Eubacteriaceae bacterium]
MMEDRFWLLENDDDLMFDFEVENSKDLILKQKTAIIKQILEHDCFREGSLKLYENVAVQNLKWTGIKGDKATSTEQIDLVLCKEDSVELSIIFQNDNCYNVRKPVLEGIHNLILKPLEIGSDNFERVLSLVVNYVDSIAENEIHNKYLLSTITFESAIRRKTCGNKSS